MTLDPPLRILTVCTGNICRSPMAEVLLQHRLDALAVPAVVRSAATHWYGYTAADAHAVAAVAERGVDLSGHRPRAVDRQLVEDDGADLILAMTREHLRQVALLGRGTFKRTFTAKELARRVAVRGRQDDLGMPAAASASDRVAGLLAAAGLGRSPADLMGADPADDVADPYGRSLSDFRRTADELDTLMFAIAASIASVLVPASDPGTVARIGARRAAPAETEP